MKNFSEIETNLRKAFQACARPPSEQLLPVGGIGFFLANDQIVVANLTREDVDKMPFLDMKLTRSLPHLGSAARRYFMPAILSKIMWTTKLAILDTSEDVLNWLSDSLLTREAPYNRATSFSEDQVLALKEFIEVVPDFLRSRLKNNSD